MKRYLLVPSAPSTVAPLVDRARELAFADRNVSFVVLAPRPRGVEDRDVADHLAGADAVLTAAQLRRRGLRVERTAVGDASPLWAVEDELRAHPYDYDAVALASRVPRVRSRLLGRDVQWRARALPLPVIPVFDGPADHLPRPLGEHARFIASRPGAFLRLVSRLLQRPRLGLFVMMLPIFVYLSAGLALALFVDRGFLLTEALAAVLYTALIAGVVIIERTEGASTPPAEADEERERTQTRR
jgi:hypothetical protein